MKTPLMTRILLATDFSHDAARALEYGMHLATAWQAALEVLHVIEAPHWLPGDTEAVAVVEQARMAAARQLEEVRDELAGNGIPAKVRLVLGNPTEHICLDAKDRGVDLVVLGVQRRKSQLYGLIGSTAEQVVKEGPCPVLVVPGCRDEAATPLPTGRSVAIRHILAPVDFSAISLDAVEYAVHLAHSFGATLTLMHVLEPVCYDLDCGLGTIEQETSKREYWNQQLTELREAIAALGLVTDLEVSGGLPSDAILACALRHHTDLIVMGTHGRGGRSPERFGSVADAVLRRATSPVLTVKTPKFAPGHHRVVPTALGLAESREPEDRLR